MQMEGNRGRMWIFILICTLGLTISQVTSEGSSKQIYFVKLTIEESAERNFTELLREPFVRNDSLEVGDLRKTTICRSVSDGTECNCTESYRWSDEVCNSEQKCCGNDTCIFPNNSNLEMCVSDSQVTVNGSITLTNTTKYQNCLLDRNNEKYKRCNDTLTREMKEVFSTLTGFDSLTITSYRYGSIIADFIMTIAYEMNTEILNKTASNLSVTLPANFFLETSGFVRLELPPGPVPYNSNNTIKCTVKDLNSEPLWELTSPDSTSQITNGTESNVTGGPNSTVELNKISELWAGKYSCLYTQKQSSITIEHKASGELDVCLLPEIEISMTPSYVLCLSQTAQVTIQCEVPQSHENYTVTWSVERTGEKTSTNRRDIYKIETVIFCDGVVPSVTCTFTNRCNQNRTETLDVSDLIISAGDKYCKAEDDWGNTKANRTAKLKCKGMAGEKERNCQKEGTWEKDEVSKCVNLDVHRLLHKAQIVDIGLGTTDENSAQVFSLLQNVTKNPKDINTFANINASVEVLQILSGKKNLYPNETSTDNFLESSSNLLDQSLQNAWKNGSKLAQTYLISVEKLIQVANISEESKKTNLAVSAQNCTEGSNCSSNLFNVSVELETEAPGVVKAAGFKELVKYLPNEDKDYTPNSLVVSATMTNTTNNSLTLKDVKITIHFELDVPRNRNVELMCVYWNNTSGSWSAEGCTWTGPSNETQCICNHLSSFAILMSKYPLDVPGTEEITYVGLSVSVASLAISLLIELIVWKAVVKTNTLYLRHIAHINISLCLLVADCCFLASFKPKQLSLIWCQALVVVKHFCYLAMFFWMLCLSSTLLHQALFLFHTVSKRNYLTYSLVVGYVCPLLIVIITILANSGGREDIYFNPETCWLVYSGLLKGSIFTFILPLGTIVLFNVFSMVVVIIKLLDHPKNADASYCKEQRAIITAVRSVVLLTPVFGVTWTLGLAVMIVDLASGTIAYVVNYAFNVLNTFQGLFILLTTCLGDKLTRDALRDRLRRGAPTSTKEMSTKDSNWK